MKEFLFIMIGLAIPALLHSQQDSLSNLVNMIGSHGAFISNGYVYVLGQSDADEKTTPVVAMAKARQDAKAKIMEFSGGFATRALDQTTFFDEAKSANLVQTAVRSRSDAYITEFQVLTDTRAFIADSTYLRTRVYARAKVVKVGGKQPQFNIKANINGARYKAGDRMTVTVASALDAWVYLFIVEQDGSASLLFPNTYSDTNRILAGSAFQMPTKKERDMTAYYEMQLPPGEKDTMELLRVVVTKNPFPAAGVAVFDDFATIFAGIPSDELEYADLVYEIR